MSNEDPFSDDASTGAPRGRIAVYVAPRHPSSRWGEFLSWLASVWKIAFPQHGDTHRYAVALAASAKEAGKGHLDKVGLENVKRSVETAKALAETRAKDTETAIALAAFDAQQRVHLATARKIDEEAKTIRSNRHLDVLERLRKMGLDAQPVLDDEGEVRIFVKKSRLPASPPVPRISIVTTASTEDETAIESEGAAAMKGDGDGKLTQQA